MGWLAIVDMPEYVADSEIRSAMDTGRRFWAIVGMARKRDGGSSLMEWIWSYIVMQVAGFFWDVECRNRALFRPDTDVEICGRTDVLDLAIWDALIRLYGPWPTGRGTVPDCRGEV